MSVDVVTLGVVCADIMARPVAQPPGPGELVFIDSIDTNLGGLAAVTAAVACQLGASAAVMARVGQDGLGDFVVQALEHHGVDTKAIRRADGVGTAATVVLVRDDGERSFLHARGANTQVQPSDIDWDLVGGARVLHWGGPALTPSLDGKPIGDILAQARDRGVTTSIDTIYDGNGIWYAHIEYALPATDIVMSSLEEARHYTGQHEPDDIADFYLDRGPSIALIKLGADGLLVKSRGERHYIPGHVVDVVDTTGAGDAACGGFLYGYLNGWDLRRCGDLANAVGAMTVQAMGGAGAGVTLAAAEALMEGDRYERRHVAGLGH